ncbi:MAG: OmpA family protein [Flavobacteriales bacterium]
MKSSSVSTVVLLTLLFLALGQTQLQGQNTVEHLVYFASDQDEPGIQESAKLDSAITFLNVLNIDHVHIVGHTDATGNSVYNQKLAQRRVDAIVMHLLRLGISVDAITSEALGSEAPLEDNATEAGKAQNRRVHVRINVWNPTVLHLPTYSKDCNGDTMLQLDRGLTVRIGRCDARRFQECIEVERAYDADELAALGMDLGASPREMLATCGMFRLRVKPNCGIEICFDKPFHVLLPIEQCDLGRGREAPELWYADSTRREWTRRGQTENRLRVRVVNGQPFAVFEITCANGFWINCDKPKKSKRVRFKVPSDHRAIQAQLTSTCRRSSSMCTTRNGRSIKCRAICAEQYTLHLKAIDLMGDTAGVNLQLSDLRYRASLFGGRCGKTDTIGRPLAGIIKRRLRRLYPRYIISGSQINGQTSAPPSMLR